MLGKSLFILISPQAVKQPVKAKNILIVRTYKSKNSKYILHGYETGESLVFNENITNYKFKNS